jgi:hypothetical protein
MWVLLNFMKNNKYYKKIIFLITEIIKLEKILTLRVFMISEMKSSCSREKELF